MNITKIKRNLAKMGIGDPLNMLIYTVEEIAEMRKNGEVMTIRPPRKYHLKQKPGYHIKSGKILVNQVFETYDEAQKWATWNSKGRGNWTIVKI